MATAIEVDNNHRNYYLLIHHFPREKKRNKRANISTAALQRSGNGRMLGVTSRPAGYEKWSRVC